MGLLRGTLGVWTMAHIAINTSVYVYMYIHTFKWAKGMYRGYIRVIKGIFVGL